MKNLTNMTVEQLEKEIHTLDEKRSAIREEMRQVHAELDKLSLIHISEPTRPY